MAGKTIDEKIDALLLAIEIEAKNKHRTLRTGWDYKEDSDLWVNSGYSRTKDWEYARKVLTELGYEVSFYYSEGSFAVDMYTLIKW